MKKTIIAVFSVSLTAGTLYLTYSQVKDYLIKKLVKSWKEEAKKQSKELEEEFLKKELDKLYLWEVKQLSTYSEKFIHKASDKIIVELFKKLKEKKIPEKANLKSLEGIIFGT